MMSRMLDPPPKSKLLLHESIQSVSLFGTMKFIHACQKLRKKESLLKMKENKSWLPKKRWLQVKFENGILIGKRNSNVEF